MTARPLPGPDPADEAALRLARLLGRIMAREDDEAERRTLADNRAPAHHGGRQGR